MTALHVVNHPYHVKRIDDPQAAILVVGPAIDDPRVFHAEPLFEGLPLSEKLRNPVSAIVKRLLPNAEQASRVYLWGVQDVISFRLLRALRGHPDLRIVPDNVEFFLRFAPKSRRSVRGLLKSAIYGQLLTALSGEVREHLGRLTFQLPAGSRIDQPYAFYNCCDRQQVGEAAHDHWTFISQPYYADHGIGEDIWARRIRELLRQTETRSGLPVRVYYHPRDSETFRAWLEGEGFTETREIGGRYIGVFSTMLFEAALSGRDVRLIFDDLQDLFAADYVDFVHWISNALGVVTRADTAMEVSPNDFIAILPPGVETAD